MGVFNFKKFSVSDDGAAMKVGTDAVLLGTWCDVTDATRMLDVGTGSGVIALILAQRSSNQCTIDAIERRKEDAEQAAANAAASPWCDKINVHHVRLQEFSPRHRFELIVCNPPFFSQSQLPPVDERARVRHDIELTTDELIAAALNLLSPHGRLSLILPKTEGDRFYQKACRQLVPRRLTRFFTRPGKSQERALMEFGLETAPLVEEDLFLYAEGHLWTDGYKKLVTDFYLDKKPF